MGRRGRDRPYPPGALGGGGGGGAGLGEPAGADGPGPGGGSGGLRAARDAGPRAGRAGDEPCHVGPSGDGRECGAAGGARHPLRGAGRGAHGRARERPRPPVRAGGDAGGDPRALRRGAAEGPPRPRHGRADAGADRSGSLHLQPQQRQAGLCHRRRPGGAGRPRDAGERADQPGRASGRHLEARRIRPRDAGRLRGRAAGRCCHLRRCRGRLAGGAGGEPEAQEGAGRGRADAGHGPQSRHPGDHLDPYRAPEAGGRLRRGDRAGDRERPEEAGPQGLRLDRGERRLGRRLRRRRQHRPSGERRRRRGLAQDAQGRSGGPTGRARGGVFPVKVLVQRLPHAEGLPLPTYATSGAAGMDLLAAKAMTVPAGGRALVPTGLCIALPEGYEMQVRPRSGLALKHGITLPNAPGTVDEDYRGEVGVILLNTGSEPFEIARGDRIAQAVFAPVTRAQWEEVVVLPETQRGGGGFGSTGRQ
ncbi:dUTP diphosphatase [Roseococcus sp. XZZS9]|uniref:Deoxyuridine 5'-triphosphate nucleotidohydrolase n=1 Tax=Roseococcus pinisoli TaxID=2835040 RepID=A0ABS5Q9Q3_9PROT|nr:dUTP diphosphatase [Roseococcus pinisoli]